jgi:nitrogen-specific signal transduction histidine kinase
LKDLHIIIADLGNEFNTDTKGWVTEMERNFVGIENDSKSFAATLNEGSMRSPNSKEKNLQNKQDPSFLSSFLVDLIDNLKNTLGTVKNYTQISRGKFNDREFGEYYYRAVTEDIEKMDMVLNSLLNYIKVQKPIRKKNTVHSVIEEVLKKYQANLDEKGIRLFKKFEQDLPETIVPDEQLKYILSSVLQYAMASTPPHWNIGLSTRSFTLEKGASEIQDLFKKDGRYIEIAVVFPGYQKPNEPGLGTAVPQKEEASDLILRFVKGVVLRNRGIMKIGADEKKTKTFISLRFPVERRKVIYYQSVN